MKINRKLKVVCWALCTLFVAACSEDKGNYDYDEIPVITLENMPESVTAIQQVDYIVLEPVIKSSVEGVITEDNPNFEFGCRVAKPSGTFDNNSRFVDINEEKTLNVKHLASFPAENYLIWYTVTDKRTNVTTNYTIPLNVTSSTYEGYLVLCNEGSENRARLDMVSVLSVDRITSTHDILGGAAPELKNAVSLYYDARPNWFGGDYLWLCTEDGSYQLDNEKLTIDGLSNIMNQFIVDPVDTRVVYTNGLNNIKQFVITDLGNLYVRNVGSATVYDSPINTFIEDGDIEFTVEPVVGVSQKRALAGGDYCALFYDKDHKRFMKWTSSLEGGKACATLADPDNKLFSFSTSKKLVTMVNTKFSNGVIYSILEDDAKQRSIYGINLDGSAFSQTYYQEMNTEGFNQATSFAFHSQYPYLFYNADNKVYCYHLLTHVLSQPLTLDGEEITLLKFNLYQNPQKFWNPSDAFAEQEHYLVVGSYKKNATDNNGGMLRFYKFDQSTGTLTKVSEYSGFARIKDVVYRERYQVN